MYEHCALIKDFHDGQSRDPYKSSCTNIRPTSVENVILFLSRLLIAGCDLELSIRPSVRPCVRPSVINSCRVKY